jgi:hypothetical protein
MQVQIEGRLLAAHVTPNGNVKGFIFDGTDAISFYSKADSKASPALVTAAHGDTLPTVVLVGEVYAGRDYDTKMPDGTLSVKVTHAETVEQ